MAGPMKLKINKRDNALIGLFATFSIFLSIFKCPTTKHTHAPIVDFRLNETVLFT